jgi:hypothetical protein
VKKARKITRKEVKAAIILCKNLQVEFDCWHGTAMHRPLLLQLEAMPVATREEDIAEAFDGPGSAIRVRDTASLDSAMETRAEEPDLLQAEAGQESSWDRR